MNAVDTAISEVQGVVGVAAKHLETGVEIRHNPDMVFFTASTFKVPVLVELYRQVDQGKIAPDERIEFMDEMRTLGGGVLKQISAGLQPTIRDLAMLMIIISDNTATDILYNMVGRDNLNNAMRELGLAKTQVPMNTRELLYSIVGLDTNDPTHTFQMASDLLSLQKLLMDSDGYSEEKSDVSSPDDMSRLLEMIYRGEVLSNSSREGALDIIKRQQLNNVIPLLLPPGTEVAHKTGSYPTVRCDVGIVYSPSGPYTVAIMAKQLTGNVLSIDLSLAAVSKAIYDNFTLSLQVG